MKMGNLKATLRPRKVDQPEAIGRQIHSETGDYERQDAYSKMPDQSSIQWKWRADS